MTIFAIKADGSRQPFQKEKIVRTCLSMGASQQVAEAVAGKIEKRVYDGIRTKRILGMIFSELGRGMPKVKHHIDLRTALSIMNPKPDFEWFVQALLKEQGYDISPSQIVRGKCVEHEVDAIARKQGRTYIVEAKHHFDPHTLTGLDVPRIARAIIEDLTDAFKLGLSSLNVDKAIVISNTKYSEHAMRYAECRGIEQIGWSYPPGRGIERMIGEKKLYPVTYLKNLGASQRTRLAGQRIVLVKELVEAEPSDLCRRTRLPRNFVDQIIGNGRTVLSNASSYSEP